MPSKAEETRKSPFTHCCSTDRTPCLTISVSWCRYQAVYNYLPRNEDELELKEGDVVDVMEKCDDGWFVGECVRSLRPLSVVGGTCQSECGR